MLRMSYDIAAFKNTLLRPKQRMLFNKQARRHVALDESSSAASSGEEEKQLDVFFENKRDDLLRWTFESEMDRKLILGMIDRNIELGMEGDASTKPEDTKQSAVDATPLGPNMDTQRTLASPKKKQMK